MRNVTFALVLLAAGTAGAEAQAKDAGCGVVFMFGVPPWPFPTYPKCSRIPPEGGTPNPRTELTHYLVLLCHKISDLR